jgi:hypothetical protein
MNANDRPVEPSGHDGRLSRRGFLAGAARRDCSGSPWCEGEAGSPVTVVSSPGRRAAGGRPQGRP